MTIINRLGHFDGKNVAVLQHLLSETPCTGEVLDDLLDAVAIDDASMQMAASWMLRQYLERGARLDPHRTRVLGEALPYVEAGFARLHLCQLMAHLQIPAEGAEAFAAFFRKSASHTNTFLRAWAPHGLHLLAQQHGEFADEARKMIEAALSDPAPSVRARARKTLAGE